MGADDDDDDDDDDSLGFSSLPLFEFACIAGADVAGVLPRSLPAWLDDLLTAAIMAGLLMGPACDDEPAADAA